MSARQTCAKKEHRLLTRTCKALAHRNVRTRGNRSLEQRFGREVKRSGGEDRLKGNIGKFDKLINQERQPRKKRDEQEAKTMKSKWMTKKKKEKERKKVRLHLQLNPQSFRSLIDKVDEGERSKVKETFLVGLWGCSQEAVLFEAHNLATGRSHITASPCVSIFFDAWITRKSTVSFVWRCGMECGLFSVG